jgi:hypothetical protein
MAERDRCRIKPSTLHPVSAETAQLDNAYNPARRHSGIDYLSPIAYEMQMLKETETT